MAKQNLTPHYVPLPGDEPPPVEVNKRGQARPQDRQRTIEITPAMLEEARLKRNREAKAYMANPPQFRSGHTLEPELMGCSYVDGEIRCSVKWHGAVVRAEGTAYPPMGVVELCIPATYVPVKGDDDETGGPGTYGE